jgi:plasmid maintenance system antidote protein VapI
MEKLTVQLREAIDGSGMSRYAVARAIDLDQSTLSRFMSGKAGLGLDTVDRLGELFGLRLVTTKTRTKGMGR